jgi:cell division protein FtsB
VLKINLLPKYIWEKRKVKQTIFVFVVLFMGVVAGMVAWHLSLAAKQRDLTAQVADMQIKANEVKQLEAQAVAEEQRIPVIQGKVSFIEGIMQYNLQYPKLYEELAKYTYSRILYRSVEASSGQLKVTAHARSIGDCGRYLLNMYRASHVFNAVGIDGVPGWPRQQSGGEDGGGQGFDFNVTCNLTTPISVPSYGAAPPQ